MQTTQRNRTIHQKTRPAARRGGRSKDETTKRPGVTYRNGFLNKQFGMLMADAEGILKNNKRISQEFVQSMSYFCSLYQLPVVEVATQPYPYNISRAYHELQAKLSSQQEHVDLLLVQQENRSICLVTAKQYPISTSLFYLPVKPLCELIEQPDMKRTATLLSFCFAYLYHVVDMPWFLHSGSFVGYTYNMIESWLEDADDEEPEYRMELLNEFKAMNIAGDALQAQLHKLKNLRGWAKALKSYKPVTPLEKWVKQVASSARKLYTEYPKRSLWKSLYPDLTDADPDENRTSLDSYFSFYWDDHSDLYETLMENVNVTLQDTYVTDLPLSLQYFDHPQLTIQHSWDFEQRIFQLVESLCDLLTDLTTPQSTP